MAAVADIKPYGRNAKIHGPEQINRLRESLRQFGFVRPLLVDRELRLIAGHGMLEAARAEGMMQVPCVLVEGLTDAQRRAYVHADNRLAELAAWDEAVLALEVPELEDLGVDMEALGFAQPDSAEKAPEPEEDDTELSVPVEPRTKPGDLWGLGRHRLLCGDSTKAEDVERLVRSGGGCQIDLLLTDPPYNVALGMGGSHDEARKRHRRTDGLVVPNDKMPEEDYRQFLAFALKNAKAVMRPGAAYYLWHASNSAGAVLGACKDAGLEPRQTLVWVKNTFTLGRQDYQWQHEVCLYGWKEGAGHSWYGGRGQGTALSFDRPVRSAEHPTMKPVALFAQQIANNTRKGAAVLDLFAGSGTTAVACEQQGRAAYMMELDPGYCDVIVDRWEKLTGQKAYRADREVRADAGTEAAAGGAGGQGAQAPE